MRIWRVGSARNALFFHSLWLGFAGWESQLLRTGGCGGSAAQDVAKFAPRLRATTIWKSKSLKTNGLGALLEVAVAKFKFVPRRRARTIWKSKSLKTEGAGAFLEVEGAKICTMHACARERFGSQNRKKLTGSGHF